MIIKRRLLSCFVAGIMLLTALGVHAEEVKEYTEKSLVNLYVSFSPEIQLVNIETELLDLKVEQKEKQLLDSEKDLSKKEKDYKKYKDSKDEDKAEDATDDYNAAVVSYYSTVKDMELLQFEEENRQDNADKEKTKLAYNFKSQIATYQKLSNQLILLDESVAYNKDLLNVAEKKYELNLTTDLEVRKTRHSFNELVLQRTSLINQLNALKGTLKSQVGYELNEDIEVIAEEKLEESLAIDLQTFINQYINKDNAYSLKVKEIEVQKVYMDQIKTILPVDHEDVIDAGYALDKMENQLYQYTMDRQTQLVDAYYQYENAIDNFNAVKDQYSIAKKQFDETTISYQAGQLSDVQYTGAHLEYTKAEMSYNDVVIDYNLAIDKASLTLKGIQ